MVASPEPTVPLYNPAGTHPDGALFPGESLSFAAFGRDGTAHTILAVETIDSAFGAWTVGAECTLVGLPSRQLDENGQSVPLEFEHAGDVPIVPRIEDFRDPDESVAVEEVGQAPDGEFQLLLAGQEHHAEVIRLGPVEAGALNHQHLLLHAARRRREYSDGGQCGMR